MSRRFKMAEQVNSFCEKYSFDQFLKMKIKTPTIDPVILQLFPINLVYFREKAGKERKLNGGWEVKGYKNNDPVYTKKLRRHKKLSTANQNNFSVYVYYAADINQLGTIARLVKHKGHGKLVSAFSPTENEIKNRKDDIRIMHRKYIDFHQLYLIRKHYDKDFLSLTDRLGTMYNCSSTGQTRLF